MVSNTLLKHIDFLKLRQPSGWAPSRAALSFEHVLGTCHERSTTRPQRVAWSKAGMMTGWQVLAMPSALTGVRGQMEVR